MGLEIGGVGWDDDGCGGRTVGAGFVVFCCVDGVHLVYICVCLVWEIEVRKVRSEAVGWYLSCIHCRVEVSSEVYAVRSWFEASILRGGCVVAGISSEGVFWASCLFR